MVKPSSVKRVGRSILIKLYNGQNKSVHKVLCNQKAAGGWETKGGGLVGGWVGSQQ